MKTDLLKPLENIPYFSITSFKQILDVDETESQNVRQMLSRWENAGHVIRLKKGIYMTRRFYESHQNHASFMPAVSAVILPQSYVSLEYILQRAGILTDVTHPVTATTAKKTRSIENVLGTFDYKHIKFSLYTGFSKENFFGVIFHQASVAKALFDFLYLRPLPRELRQHSINLSEELRLNIDEFSTESQQEFSEYIQLANTPKMTYIFENFRRTVWQR